MVDELYQCVYRRTIFKWAVLFRVQVVKDMVHNPPAGKWFQYLGEHWGQRDWSDAFSQPRGRIYLGQWADVRRLPGGRQENFPKAAIENSTNRWRQHADSSLNIQLGMLSGPVASSTLMRASFFSTSSTRMMNLSGTLLHWIASCSWST